MFMYVYIFIYFCCSEKKKKTKVAKNDNLLIDFGEKKAGNDDWGNSWDEGDWESVDKKD